MRVSYQTISPEARNILITNSSRIDQLVYTIQLMNNDKTRIKVEYKQRIATNTTNNFLAIEKNEKQTEAKWRTCTQKRTWKVVSWSFFVQIFSFNSISIKKTTTRRLWKKLGFLESIFEGKFCFYQKEALRWSSQMQKLNT